MKLKVLSAVLFLSVMLNKSLFLCCSSLLSLIAQQFDTFWNIKMSNTGGFFSLNFCWRTLTTCESALLVLGQPPEHDPRRQLEAVSPVPTAEIIGVKSSTASFRHDCVLADVATSGSWLRHCFVLPEHKFPNQAAKGHLRTIVPSLMSLLGTAVHTSSKLPMSSPLRNHLWKIALSSVLKKTEATA